jgi:hypothetical protein
MAIHVLERSQRIERPLAEDAPVARLRGGDAAAD